MQIAKTTPKVLSPIESDIVSAQKGKICRIYSNEDLMYECVKLFGEIYLLIRWETPPPKDLAVMAMQLSNDYLKKYFQTLTFDEVRFVCKNGIAKFYGDFTTISPATVASWLNKYMASPERDMAKKHLKELSQPKEEVKLPENELNKKAYELISGYYKKEGKAPHLGEWDKCFKHLEAIGEIKDSIEEKRMFMENVVADISEYISSRAKNKSQREDMLNEWTDERVISECRKRRCMIYFENAKRN